MGNCAIKYIIPIDPKNMKKLFLNDIRDPNWIYDQIEANFEGVRNYEEFINYQVERSSGFYQF